jgi:triphosphoribosyl-dephospho-CoA synthase
MLTRHDLAPADGVIREGSMRQPRAPPAQRDAMYFMDKPAHWRTVQRNRRQDLKFCSLTGRLAVRSLYTELALYPKPGLVSMMDSGSHDDMDAHTFMRSLFALRHYFVRIALAGFHDAPFAKLKRLGIEAEARMMRATGGINTHRGAIFCLGMLCAALGRCRAQRTPSSPQAIRAILLTQWGEALDEHTRGGPPRTHGQCVAATHAVSGAREEVAQGLPSVFDIALPALQQALAEGRGVRAARVDAIFSLMAHINDTNVYHRGGAAGADTVKTCARTFLDQGGSAHPEWEGAAQACHRLFVEKRLSPGGAADLLAATVFVYQCTEGLTTPSWQQVA